MITRMFVLLACLLSFSLASPPRDRTTPELLQEVLTKGDTCDVPAVFEALGKRMDEEAFDAMVKGIEALLEADNQRSALRGLRHFVHVDVKLQSKVIKYLHKELKQPSDTLAYPLASALAEFGSAAHDELIHHMDRPFPLLVRAQLVGGALDSMVLEGGFRHLERILRHYYAPFSGDAESLEGAVTRLYAPAHRRKVLKLLDQPGPLETNVKQIVQAFGTIGRADVDDLLGELAAASNEDLRALAAEALVFREGQAATKLLRERYKAERFPGARGQALKGLLARPATVEDALEDLRALAGSKAETDRQAAAIALGAPALGDVQILNALLSDPDTLVRLYALSAVRIRREKASIGALIERLDAEEDKKLVDVHEVLRKLTGEDFGERPHRWRTWWAREEAAFVLPSSRDARAKTKTRDVERMRRERGSQYGLNPEGKGIYFVLDLSDSMKGYYDHYRTSAGKYERLSHLDILGEEMVGVFERMKDAQLFNVILFGSSVEKLAPGLIPLNEETRAQATTFVQRKETLGATALHDALEAAFEDRKMDTIYLISDGPPQGGKVDDPEALLSLIKKWNRRRQVRIHCINLHQISSDFLKSLAEQNGGEAHHVPPPR